jgi:hypothetical protein
LGTKTKEKISACQSLKLEFQEHMRNFFLGSARARKDILKSNFILCRKFGNGGLGQQQDRAVAPLPRGGDE